MENPPNEAQAMKFDDEALQEWASYKAKFGKTYEDPEEDQARMKVFMENKQMINAHNAKYELGQVSYTMGINDFTDMHPHEYKKMASGLALPRNDARRPRESRWDATSNAPASAELSENVDS